MELCGNVLDMKRVKTEEFVICPPIFAWTCPNHAIFGPKICRFQR